MDYEVGRSSRHCTATGREIQPGETFYSTLIVQGADVLRQDYSSDGWLGPPEGVLGWWQSTMPARDAKRQNWAPSDIMLDLLEDLAEQSERQDMRYVLSLLLIRRRVVRLEDSEHDELGREVSLLYCPRRDVTYRVLTVIPGDERAKTIQQELAALLQARPG
jgi:hypothetical protein